jgi:hypothetical protein
LMKHPAHIQAWGVGDDVVDFNNCTRALVALKNHAEASPVPACQLMPQLAGCRPQSDEAGPSRHRHRLASAVFSGPSDRLDDGAPSDTPCGNGPAPFQASGRQARPPSTRRRTVQFSSCTSASPEMGQKSRLRLLPEVHRTFHSASFALPPSLDNAVRRQSDDTSALARL